MVQVAATVTFDAPPGPEGPPGPMGPPGPAGDAGSGVGRIRLAAPLSLYVAPDGSDSAGDGSPTAKWATPQHAYNVLRDNFDFAGKPVTVCVAPGTYAPMSAQGRCVGQVGPNSLQFVGDPVNPANCILNAVNANAVTVDTGAQLRLRGFEMRATGAVPYGFGCVVGAGWLTLGINFWRNCSRGFIDVGNNRGIISIVENQAFFSNAPLAIVAEAGGHIFALGVGLYYYGGPAFSIANVVIDQGAFVDFTNSTFYEMGGAVGGAKYNITSRGKLILGGATIPGSGVAGDGSGFVQA